MNSSNEAPIALITGAAKRLGRCIANQLHQSGYDIVIHYQSSEQDANELARALNQSRPESAQIIQADLANLDALERIENLVKNLSSPLSLLVNNASAFYPTELSGLAESDWNHIMGTNVKAPLFLAQKLAPFLKRSGGNIINLVDIYSEKPLQRHPIYNISKAAMEMLTKTLALEMSPDIRVNGISPGAILWPEQNDSESYQKQLLNKIPLGKNGNPEDIARTALFLASSPYINGQIIKVDGGRSLNM